MQQILLFISAAFCFFHSYRDWLHSKGRFDKWYLRIAHWWDAPQYEKHGMVAYGFLGAVCLFIAL
jgi:hypothetical protein